LILADSLNRAVEMVMQPQRQLVESTAI